MGGPSSDLRQAIQKNFDRLIKKRTDGNCQKLLLKCNIVPGPFAFHRPQEAEESAAKDEMQSAAPNTIKEQHVEEEDPSIEESSSESFNGNPFVTARSFKSLFIEKLPPALARKTVAPAKTPNSRKGQVAPAFSSSGCIADPCSGP
jgi:hypothetical protein